MLGLMGIISLLLPALIGYINHKMPDSFSRFLASLSVCAVFGIVLNVIDHNALYTGMNLSEIVNSISNSILVLTGLVKISYEVLWDNPALGKFTTLDIKKTTDESPLKQLDLKGNGK